MAYSIWLENFFDFSLRVDSSYHNLSKVAQLLNEDNGYELIKVKFGNVREESLIPLINTLSKVKWNYCLVTPFDERFDYEQLAFLREK